MEWIQCKYCIHICVNAKTIPVEIVPGIKHISEGVNSSMNDRNLYKYYNVPPPLTI
jgi:hypothetical protein